MLRQVDDLVDRPLNFESVWVHMLADFTFETLPVKRAYVLVLGIWWFFLFLSQHPVLQTLEMDETDGTFTLASNNQWIRGVLLRTPANSALNILLILGAEVLDTLDLLSFFEFLVVELSLAHHNLIALEIFDSESDSTKFDSVKFLNLIIVLSGFIFQ